MASTTRLLKYFVAGAGLAALALAVYAHVREAPGDPRPAHVQQASPAPGAPSAGAGNAPATASSDWTVGELRPNGLRIKPSGRNDASAVLDPSQFVRSEVRRAYQIAHEIPATLNQLYCWCGCENRGVHRSNLGCFEDEMAVSCDVCRGTAKIAYRMIQEGTTDVGKIQAAVDMEWGPEKAQKEQRDRRDSH